MAYLLLVLAFFLGYYLRELKQSLLSIKNQLDRLKQAQDKAEKPKGMGFAEPGTRAEAIALLEEEKINLLNQ